MIGCPCNGLSLNPTICGINQSRSQKPQAFMSAVGRLERLWGNQIKYIFFWLAVSCNDLTTVLRQRSWRTCIPLSQSLSRRPTTDKEPEDYGLDIDFNQFESLPTKTVMTGRHKGGYRAPVILVPGVARVGPDRGKAACKVAMEPDSTTEETHHTGRRPVSWGTKGRKGGKEDRKEARQEMGMGRAGKLRLGQE